MDLTIGRKVLRKLTKLRYRARNKNRSFTLLSQNCIGGVIYNYLGLEFQTPTINAFIEDENFVKLAEDPEYYLSLPAVPKCEMYTDPVDPSITYPIIAVGDIEICCLHSESCEAAVADWERRRKRVDLSNIYVIGNTWNLHGNPELISRLEKCGYPTVIFTNLPEYRGERFIALEEPFWKLDDRGILRPNITDEIPGSHKRYFEEKFDFVRWLNQKGN